MALRTVKHETAARMIAEDCEPDHRIARALGVSRRTVQYWKKRPEVRARIREIVKEAVAQLDAHYERLEWLWEVEICREGFASKNPITKRVALMRFQELVSESQRKKELSASGRP